MKGVLIFDGRLQKPGFEVDGSLFGDDEVGLLDFFLEREGLGLNLEVGFANLNGGFVEAFSFTIRI